MKTGNYKSSPVKMVDKNGNSKWFVSISEAARYAHANAWTISLKMQVFGYFEDKSGNKYYRLDEMKTKNNYTYVNPTPKIKHERKVERKKRSKSPVPVYVDDVYYENCLKAAEAIGVASDTIAAYVRMGRNTVKGHKIYTVEEWNKKHSIKEEKIQPVVEKQQKIQSIVVETDDPVIQMINERIVKILKDAGVYEEIKKLSEAIAKLSK